MDRIPVEIGGVAGLTTAGRLLKVGTANYTIEQSALTESGGGVTGLVRLSISSTISVGRLGKYSTYSSISIISTWNAAGQTCDDLGTVTTADINGGTWQGTIDGNWNAAGQTCSDLGTVTTADINGGTWQGTIDGGWNAAGQTCSDLGTVTTADINGGTWQGTIDGNWNAAGQTCSDLGTVTTADINGGTWQGTIDGNWNATGQTCSDLGTVTTADINGGTIDGAVIGGASAAAITGTTITADDLSLGGQTVDDILISSDTVSTGNDELATAGYVAEHYGTAAANITDNAIVRGDGGAKGVQDSLVTIDDSGTTAIPDGSAAAPSFTFTSDTDSGLYRIGADNVGMSCGGSLVMEWDTAGVEITGTLDVSPDTDVITTFGRAKCGTISGNADEAVLGHIDQWNVNSVAIRQTASGQTLLSCASGQNMALRVNGDWKLLVNSTSVWVRDGVPLLLSEGSAASPGLTYSNDTNTGLYRIGADNVGMSCGGSLVMEWDTAGPKLPSATVANLPAGAAGNMYYASDGRKAGEGAGAGTGVMVFHDGSNWIACDTGATVAA